MTSPAIETLGELRASGHVHRGVKTEIRQNLINRLAAGEPSMPGIVGFDDTVIPEVERALLAVHDIVLLGERGQGKNRLIRSIDGLLDEWTPVVTGWEINDQPNAPESGGCHASDAPAAAASLSASRRCMGLTTEMRFAERLRRRAA